MLTMNTFRLAFLPWLVACGGSLSAPSRILMSVTTGSTALLPCDWRNGASKQSSKTSQQLHVEWRTISETVFERRGWESYQGEGYENRVDVPEDSLLSGDCSLVLKDVRPSDAGPYESYLMEVHPQRSLRSRRVLIQSVELSVEEAVIKQAAEQTNEEVSVLQLMAKSKAGLITALPPIMAFTLTLNAFLLNI